MQVYRQLYVKQESLLVGYYCHERLINIMTKACSQTILLASKNEVPPDADNAGMFLRTRCSRIDRSAACA